MSLPDSCSQKKLVDERLSFTRKLALLMMFCFAKFMDSFNNSALIPAIPSLEYSIGITESQSAWIISAFQLTFASFLLISGRVSDVYNPKTAFVSGVLCLGILSIGTGFVSSKIAIIILRALMGISSAMIIPSALTLLVNVFPEPLEQARAIGVFGGCGAIANVLGLFIGAVLIQYASYHWVFWFVAIIAVSVAAFCLFIIPPEAAMSKEAHNAMTAGPKWKSLDLIGITILTVALILFIYAVTSGSVDGWGTAGVITPLVISLVLMAGFFYWETLVPPEKAAVPPHIWFYNNFSVLFALALFPYFWWSAVLVAFTTLWQDIFHWTVLSTAIHMLPIGVVAAAISLTGSLSRKFSPKWIILTGFSLVAVATVLLAVRGSRPQNYWPFIFPAFSIGSAGTMLIYMHTNIAIFRAGPSSMSGMIGAIFNAALGFGSAIGLAAFTSIETSVEIAHGGPQQYAGRAAAFWFLFGIEVIEILALLYFYDRGTDHRSQPKLNDHGHAERDAGGDLEKIISATKEIENGI